MKITVQEYIGPNTVIGRTSRGLVRARVPTNGRPGGGESIELPETEFVSWTAPKVAAEPEPEKNEVEK